MNTQNNGFFHLSQHIRSSSILLLLGILCIWSVIIALCWVFVSGINQITRQEVDRYLLEISSGISTSVNALIESTFTILDSVGGFCIRHMDDNPAFASRYLREKSIAHGFKRIIVVDRSGRILSSDGRAIDTSALSKLAEAFEGTVRIRRQRSSPVDGSDGILYAGPIRRDGKIVGAFTAWSDVDHIRQFLDAPLFGGKGHLHVLDVDGNVLLSPPEEDALTMPNYFDLLEKRAVMLRGSINAMRRDMHAGGSGRLDFNLDGVQERAAAFVPFWNGRLYLVGVVPSFVAWAKFDGLLRQTLLIVFLIVAMFTGLAVLLFFRDRKAAQALAATAFIDPITGGMTRARFQLEAPSRIAAAPPGKYSLVSVNIKQFKLVNDILGTKVGDLLLKQFHDCTKSFMAPDEMICRDYADGFVLLVTTKDRETTFRIVDSIVMQINHFLAETQCRHKILLYFGIYEIEDKSLSLVGMLDRANIARGRSKAAPPGRLGEYVFYNDFERQRMIKTKDIENKMADALADGSFLVYLQPKIELESLTVTGAEALVRWLDKDAGIIPPDEFIPCFEANGFITKLDLHVFKESCRIVRSWIDAGLHPVPVSVNLSRAHFTDPNFLETYAAIRDKFNIPRGLLEIELTETMLFENLAYMRDVVNRLHGLGFSCSLDDFGSGYSSLNMLKDINVDTLKLDGAFWVSPGADNRREKDIIAAVVDLARKLGMTTVSEGVETASQLEFLRQIHCDMVQGYVFSKPVAPDAFAELAFGNAAGTIR